MNKFSGIFVFGTPVGFGTGTWKTDIVTAFGRSYLMGCLGFCAVEFTDGEGVVEVLVNLETGNVVVLLVNLETGNVTAFGKLYFIAFCVLCPVTRHTIDRRTSNLYKEQVVIILPAR